MGLRAGVVGRARGAFTLRFRYPFSSLPVTAMAQQLPYRLRTRTGDVIDFEFELHAETGSPVRVAQLLDALLETLDREIQVLGETSNGDILQSLAMALAARARMIHAPVNQTSTLARTLVEQALDGAAKATTDGGMVGHA